MRFSARIVYLLILTGIFCKYANALANTELQEGPLVKKVDHIVVQTDDPKGLFDLMAETLGLPVAWTLAVYPGFSTGGIHAGNVNIELLTSANPKMPQSMAPYQKRNPEFSA